VQRLATGALSDTNDGNQSFGWESGGADEAAQCGNKDFKSAVVVGSSDQGTAMRAASGASLGEEGIRKKEKRGITVG